MAKIYLFGQGRGPVHDTDQDRFLEVARLASTGVALAAAVIAAAIGVALAFFLGLFF